MSNYSSFLQGGISSILEDTSPVLGGDLNTSAYTVSGTGTIITGDHGPSTHPEVINTIYATVTGTVDAANTPVGTMYIVYEV